MRENGLERSRVSDKFTAVVGYLLSRERCRREKGLMPFLILVSSDAESDDLGRRQSADVSGQVPRHRLQGGPQGPRGGRQVHRVPGGSHFHLVSAKRF